MSATTKPRQTQPPPRTADGAWRYWISVTFTDGRSAATLELRRTTPIISSADRSALADGLAAHLQRPITSIRSITPITRPHPVTGEPEPDVHPSLRTSPADDLRPWRYRVSYVIDGGHGECKVELTEPIRGSDDLKALQESITAKGPCTVVAIESFSVLAAPAQTGPRGSRA